MRSGLLGQGGWGLRPYGILDHVLKVEETRGQGTVGVLPAATLVPGPHALSNSGVQTRGAPIHNVF